jgi:DNA adenine methylase
VEQSESGLPFLKSPGGKRWASERIVGLIRKRLTKTYYEPFLGGGSVFFAFNPERAILSDINEDLINTYQIVRDRAPDVIRRLKRLRVNKSAFERIRRREPEDPLDRAVRFLYLNRTAFAGIYRVNLEGKFNVPFGGGERTPEVLWRKNLLLEAAARLGTVQLRQADFECVIDQAGDGDVVYCDPTYTVAHENNGFVRYNERNFSWADQIRLADSAERARKRGAFVLISNACHPTVRCLYINARIRVLERSSRISTDVTKRRPVRELLICLESHPDGN